MTTVYLNGEFLPEDQACVPVWDRGFIFGDGVYEVIPVYGGRLFRPQEHLARLNDSLAAVHITSPYTYDEWSDILSTLITRNGGGDLSVYLQLTRGVAKRDHAFPADKKPTVFISAAPLSGVSAELLEQGVAAITLEDIRWKYCHIKAIALLPNILLRQQAIDAGAVEAILHREQQVTEGAASNIFIVNKGRILTPPKGRYLLPGITRDLVLELAMANGIPCQEEQVLFSDLEAAEEIWLTSSTREILPVTRLNGQPVGDGSPGPVWRRMFDLYQVFKHTLRN